MPMSLGEASRVNPGARGGAPAIPWACMEVWPIVLMLQLS